MELFQNPHRTRNGSPQPPPAGALAFHRRLEGYAPTPLVELPALAKSLGLETLWVKDESERLGLPSFKMLGASWAIFCALRARAPELLEGWTTVADLADRIAPLRPMTLAAATDGNHGRAVARMARRLGLEAVILVPRGTAAARIDAIASEGARVTVVDGNYDFAIEASARLASERTLVISDTAWPGYEETPRRVIEGYATVFEEVFERWQPGGRVGIDTLVVQMGVGALAAAGAHFVRRQGADHVRLLVVEPDDAACGLASARAGQRVVITGEQRSIMVGLNCATPSWLAWPDLQATVDCFLAIEDDYARQAMRLLADHGIVAGETGAAGVAALLALRDRRAGLCSTGCRCLGGSQRVLTVVTEGATDPAAYRDIVGATPAEVRLRAP